MLVKSRRTNGETVGGEPLVVSGLFRKHTNFERYKKTARNTAVHLSATAPVIAMRQKMKL